MQLELKVFKEYLQSKKKILFITNRNSFFNNKFDELLTENLQSEQFLFFNDFELNPRLDEVMQVYHKFKEEKFDTILGVGGGSALDFAKSLYYFLGFNNLEKKYDFLQLISSPKDLTSSIDLLLIPTTSGSGSEATHFSVIYDNHLKMSLAHQSLIPKHFVLDGLFTQSLPFKITAYTVMDALVHSIESYWAVNATDESRGFSLKAIKIIIPLLSELKKLNITQRTQLAHAANLAGAAINISKTTAAHALSYYLTSFYNIPHGQAVANCLPYFIEKNSSVCDLTEIYNLFKVANQNEFEESFVQLLKLTELNLDIPSLITHKEDFIGSVNMERLKNNPYQFTHSEMLDLFTNHQKT